MAGTYRTIPRYRVTVMWWQKNALNNLEIVDASFDSPEEMLAFLQKESDEGRYHDVIGYAETYWVEEQGYQYSSWDDFERELRDGADGA